jgi:arsenite methyltransferase
VLKKKMNPEKCQDKWARWMLQTRFGGDSEEQKKGLTSLARVRDKVLENAKVADGDILLDVGTGDGLISFGALDKVGAQGKVIFSDISQDLLDYCRSLAEELAVLERCRFLCTPADKLTGCDDTSVDVVTTRSVLIYIEAKQSAFKEFYRVLKHGGRLSIFEPINRFSYNPSRAVFWGCDAAPVMGIADKIKAIYTRLQPDTDPMLDFDERDLLNMAKQAGFSEAHLELHADITGATAAKWETFIHIAPNPLIPSLEEAVKQGLTQPEIDVFTNHLRPLVEAGKGTRKWATAYLWAQKS